jgi:hypothetical protein
MTDAQGNTMDPELAKAIEYAEKLHDAAISVVDASPEHVELNQNWARDPKIVGLTILCRSISNFRAAVLLVRQEQPLEAGALVRLLYENLLWLAALKERGLEFVRDMREDEAFNREALTQLTLELNSTRGGDVSGPAALKLRNLIKDQRQQFPKPKKLSAGKTPPRAGLKWPISRTQGCRSMPCIAQLRRWDTTYRASAHKQSPCSS